MPRYFTLAEAEQALPTVERALRDALFHRAGYQQASETLERELNRIRDAGGSRVNPGPLLALRSTRDTSAIGLKAALEQVEQAGAMVKDLDIGLIDFLAQYRGRDVCLCWKLGEEHIGFWHDLEEGFQGRKPIDDEFREKTGWTA
jgi:hypothetical protein